MTQPITDPLDIAAIRADFPILNQEVHPGKRLAEIGRASCRERV